MQNQRLERDQVEDIQLSVQLTPHLVGAEDVARGDLVDEGVGNLTGSSGDHNSKRGLLRHGTDGRC